MKFYKAGIIVLFLLMFSMGIVCAQDSNQTAHDALEIDDNADISISPNKTYTDLREDIDASAGSIELEHNYTYNYQEDGNKTLLIFNNKNYTISGNNNFIDANNEASFLYVINGSNLTIKNLLVKNCNITAIVVYAGSTLTLTNVTFENNRDFQVAGAIYVEGSRLNVVNNRFLNNYAPAGASIYAIGSEVNINDTLFKNDDPIYWSIVKGSESIINIYNSTFANITSKYATAIQNSYLTNIRKSKFINLYANATAGAIAIKGDTKFSSTTISDCEFINVSSAKNGGALFLDIAADTDGKLLGSVIINNTLFNNCSSEFGGALIQLGGSCLISNSQFIDNRANERGGAVYTSFASLIVNDCNFTDNAVDRVNGYGGAIFVDANTTKISNSTFKNNVANEGGAIYVYDSLYIIKDCKFDNDCEDIHTYFDDSSSIIINCGDVNSTLNDTNYNFDVRYAGNPIVLNPTKINASASDPYFNLRDLGLVTPVRNQGSMGSCWAFGSAGSFESAFLIATGIPLDISENNIQNLGLRYSIYGNPYLSESGTYLTSTGYFLSWLGAINTPDDTYDELGKISSLSFSPDAYHIVDAIFIDVADRDAIKEALTKYGALNLFVYGANSQDPKYFSENFSSVYYYGNGSGNHYVTLVGWNDTFSKNNFVKEAPGDGAWICKNSWGTEWGDGGYYYLSYYDNALKNCDVVGFIIENTERYEKLYQIEVGGFTDFYYSYDEYMDVFVSENGDIIAAVGTYFEKADTPYTVSVYIDDNLVYTQNGKSKHAGYDTIKLDQYVAVEDGHKFSIRIKSSSTPILYGTRQKFLTNNSFVIKDNEAFYLEDGVVPIKVYTYHTSLATESIRYFNNNGIIFSILDGGYGNVTIGFNGKNTTVDLNGSRYDMNLGVLNVGTYELTITYNNLTYKNYVIVKSTIDTDDVTKVTIAYNVELSFNSRFFDVNGNPLANTEIGVKFDGETAKGFKTDKDGYSTIVLYAGNSIGTHYLDYVNPANGESLRVTVVIVSRFVGNSNVNMYYFDGHAYKVRVRDNLGNFVGKNQVITVKIGKKTFNVKTDASGYATIKIPNTITPGKYTISATYMGQTVKNSLVVKQVLKLTKVKVKRSSKKLVLKATLKQGSKALKSKKVTFKFNGKKYSTKTNKKGIAKVTVKKSVLKKLKVGKKVTYQVTYLKNTVKRTAKVKR